MIFRREKQGNLMIKSVLLYLLSGWMCAISFSGYCFPAGKVQSSAPDFNTLASRIGELNAKSDFKKLIMISDSLLNSLKYFQNDTVSIAEIYYFAGVSDLCGRRYYNSLNSFRKCIQAKEVTNSLDYHYVNALFDAGIASSEIGDFYQAADYYKAFEVLALKNNGNDSGPAAEAYSALAGTSLNLDDIEGFLQNSFKTMAILKANPYALDAGKLSDFNHTMGVGYSRMGDFNKARLYLEKSESLIEEYHLPYNESYINLINSLAYTYSSLGLNDKAQEYFNKGIDLAVRNSSGFAFNLLNTYAISLANSGNIKKGSGLLSDVLRRAETAFNGEGHLYHEAISNYAAFLVNYSEDTTLARHLYEKLNNYISINKNDYSLKTNILAGNAQLLFLTRKYEKALENIAEVLSGKVYSTENLLRSNPPIDSIPVTRTSLSMLKMKFDILWLLYSEKGEMRDLLAAAETSETMISLLDRFRVIISEEESRIILGDRYRNTYLNAIASFELCYRRTGNRKYLEKTFEYGEKSKVAGLLAATRQMNAVQFQIPGELAGKEQLLQNRIAFYNARVLDERAKTSPDKTALAAWNEKLLASVSARDSLILTFERDYPDYYTLKYNNRVPGIKEIRSVTGRSNNYLNYVISDSTLYIFLVNRKNAEVFSFKVDSSFFRSVAEFRSLLSDPSLSENARIKFDRYRTIGSDLYRKLIQPVSKYFTNDRLLISPDNVLSYLPFETFLSSDYKGTDILYRKLDYLMNDYDISYTYSVAFMKENMGRRIHGGNKLVAFAPDYPQALDIDSLLSERQQKNRLLDLPFARQEAEYVAGITHGTLFMNNEAVESAFKHLASQYDLIHLAMHTIMDDRNPMNSAMIFSQKKDSADDGLLHTYEVYGIPLKARMVVLSSCNTGSGSLSTGEGILSLARGFMYSGSRSVVMSLWKIEDRSGTDIIKMFYDNLRKGMTKSRALRNARNTYLRNASQLRSHPYFWSTLVVFGDNEPVFRSWKPVMTVGAALLAGASVLLFYYFLKRRYS